MQIFPRAVASLSLFKAIIWERSFSRGCSSRTQGGWAGVSGPLWAGTEVPGPRKGKEKAPGALSSGCAAFPRLGIGGFLNASEKPLRAGSAAEPGRKSRYRLRAKANTAQGRGKGGGNESEKRETPKHQHPRGGGSPRRSRSGSRNRSGCEERGLPLECEARGCAACSWVPCFSTGASPHPLQPALERREACDRKSVV